MLMSANFQKQWKIYTLYYEALYYKTLYYKAFNEDFVQNFSIEIYWKNTNWKFFLKNEKINKINK